MSKSLITGNNSLHIQEAILKNLSSGGRSRGGEYVSARTQRRAAASEQKRALKKQHNKEKM